MNDDATHSNEISMNKQAKKNWLKPRERKKDANEWTHTQWNSAWKNIELFLIDCPLFETRILNVIFYYYFECFSFLV